MNGFLVLYRVHRLGQKRVAEFTKRFADILRIRRGGQDNHRNMPKHLVRFDIFEQFVSGASW